MLGALIALRRDRRDHGGSASISIADQQTGEPLFYLERQLGALVIGVLGMLVAACVPTELWYRLNWLLLVAAFALLAVVLIPGIGHAVNGSRRWLLVGPVNLQASELARLCLLLYLSSYAVRRAEELGTSLNGLGEAAARDRWRERAAARRAGFRRGRRARRDGLGVLFLAGARLRDFLLAVAVGGVLARDPRAVVAVPPARLTVFLDPWADPFDSGFQLTQSLIAIGRGEWSASGLGESVQKLFYLPEAHTDFVFAVLAEELGFVGARS